MATRVQMKVTGLRELGAAMRGMSEDVQQRLARRATGVAANVVKTAVAEKAAQQPTLADAPFTHGGVTYQPGHVARNVVAAKVKQPETTSEHVVAVLSNSRNGYAGRIAAFNEFGTVNMPAQPFMTPAWEASKGEAAATVARELSKGIESAARKRNKGKK